MSKRRLLVMDRATGLAVEERVFGAVGLGRIYGDAWWAGPLRALVARPAASALWGLWQRRAGSQREIAGFVRDLGIDASEAELPLDAYPSLDAFFTRRLRPGARPVDAARGAVVSPADGRALAFPSLAADDAPSVALPVKGRRVTLARMLGGPAPFLRCAVLVVRLAPADYHRFHAPADGALSTTVRLGGPLHSVHPFALRAGAPSFANRRHVTRLETDAFGALVLVEVGALLVGAIERTRGPGPVLRGEELGLFHFGGSTVVVVADAARVCWDDDLCANTARGLETMVRMGTRVGGIVGGARVEVTGAPGGAGGRPSGAG